MKYVISVERNFVSKGYINWQKFLKSRFVASTSRVARTKFGLCNWEFSFDPVSCEAITDVPGSNDCEMKHEAKLSLLGCYTSDLLLPNGNGSHMGDRSDILAG